MRKMLPSCFLRGLLRAAVLISSLVSVSGFASGQTQYILTNDDLPYPFGTGVSFYTVWPGGALTLQEQVKTNGFGIAGGLFGSDGLSVLNSGGQQCVYSSEAMTGDIVGIVISTLTVGGNAFGSPTDGGTSNGIGLAMN